MQYGFGIDVGGTTVKLAFFDRLGSLLDKWEIPTVTENHGGQILPDIAISINNYLAEKSIPREKIIGIGIAVPGPVNNNGIVNRCTNLGWGVFHIAEALSQLVDFPVTACNDATAAALGECWKGGGEGYQNLLLVTLGTGVGGGIVLDGKPLYGARGAAGEIGHIVLNREEPRLCTCGKYDCAEQYCSATGIVRTAKQILSECPQESLLRNETVLSCKAVFDAAAQKDSVAIRIVEQVYSDLAELIADICNTLDPEVVVIGGGVSKAGPMLLEGIHRYLPQYIFHAISDVKLALATLGNDAGAYGAFKLVLDKFYNE